MRRRSRFKHYAAGIYLVSGLLFIAGAAGASDLEPDKPIPWGVVLIGLAFLVLAWRAGKVADRRERDG